MIKQRPEHVTAATVAKEVGVSVRTIHRWESGHTEPTVSQWMTYVLACEIHHQLAFHIEMNAAMYDWDEKHPDELDE
jgi:DNA-binding XRE family transcriptional regulator